MSLENIRLSVKLSAITALSLLSLVLMTVLALRALDDNLMQERENQAKSIVLATSNILADLQKRVDAQELSLEEAQKQARASINAVRYGENDYLWVNDLSHVMVVHPISPKLIGKDMSDFKDPTGKFLFRDIVSLAKSAGEGAITYKWAKPGFNKPVGKVSYIKLFEPWGWVVGTGVYVDNVDATFWKEATKSIVIFIVIALLMSAFVFLVSRDISKSIRTLSQTMTSLAKGAIQSDVPLVHRLDEMGDMAKSVEYFREQLVENERLAAQQKAEEEIQRKRALTINKLAEDFDMGVNIALESVASAAKQLDVTANGMSATAAQTSTQASAVATASQQTTSNVQTVAAASEELTASIYEVGKQVQNSASIAKQAAVKAGDSRTTIHTLSTTAERISEASSLIGDIAAQTNMLALNATIEAARAGDMGKGFAVVASEVKNLATQTGRATDEINAHVRAIQDVSGQTVQAIEEINQTIEEMNDIAAAVAAAVEQQSAATSEIARNIEEASHGTQQVNDNIIEVHQAADDTGKASREVLDASALLNEQSVSLRNIVEGFLKGVKSA